MPAENKYQNLIDFIDAAVDSNELMDWLINLEKLPDNLRNDHLAQMKTRMSENNEPDKIIDIVESLNKREILSAVNLVVKEVYDSGMKTNKFLNTGNAENFNVLVNLITPV
jgi:hypothetical protein